MSIFSFVKEAGEKLIDLLTPGNANAGEHPFQELHCLILSKRMEYQDIASIRPDSTPRIGDSIP